MSETTVSYVPYRYSTRVCVFTVSRSGTHDYRYSYEHMMYCRSTMYLLYKTRRRTRQKSNRAVWPVHTSTYVLTVLDVTLKIDGRMNYKKAVKRPARGREKS